MLGAVPTTSAITLLTPFCDKCSENHGYRDDSKSDQCQTCNVLWSMIRICWGTNRNFAKYNTKCNPTLTPNVKCQMSSSEIICAGFAFVTKAEQADDGAND